MDCVLALAASCIGLYSTSRHRCSKCTVPGILPVCTVYGLCISFIVCTLLACFILSCLHYLVTPSLVTPTSPTHTILQLCQLLLDAADTNQHTCHSQRSWLGWLPRKCNRRTTFRPGFPEGTVSVLYATTCLHFQDLSNYWPAAPVHGTVGSRISVAISGQGRGCRWLSSLDVGFIAILVVWTWLGTGWSKDQGHLQLVNHETIVVYDHRLLREETNIKDIVT